MSILMPSVPTPVAPARLVATEGRLLPLETAEMRVDAKCGLARVVFAQRFKNPHSEPLTVTYKLALPADAAVSGFAFRIGDRTIRGAIEGRLEAREQFERAIVEGRSAALLEEDRSSLFTQEIGNIPPGETVVAEIEIDQPLRWLDEGSWEWRFPLAGAPRYLGAGPIEGDVSLDVATGDPGARASLVMAVRDAVVSRRSPESPSHPLVCSAERTGFTVELGSGNRVALDRDVVVRWPVATFEPGASIDVARPAEIAAGASAFGLVTLVPPSLDAAPAAVPRDMSLLIDTSGSMSGEPLEQAKHVASALVDSLEDGDTLEMIEFSSRARAFMRSPELATPALKKRALSWIRSLKASGGTEMVTGVHEALRDIRAGSQRQVVMITDGLVGFEREVVRVILDRLPASARFHVVGVGSAVNRSLLMPVARAGRGTEALIGLGEDAERAVARLLARMATPILVDLSVTGSAVRAIAPKRLPDCFQGAPARLGLELDPNGGQIVVRGRLGGAPFERVIEVAPIGQGAGSAAIAKLFAREAVEDVEMELTAGIGMEHDKRIEHIGKAFSIATRLTSFIAVTAEATVDPRAPSRREVQPQALPYGMSAEGLGLRQAMSPPLAMAPLMAGPATRSRRGEMLGAGTSSPPPPPPGAAFDAGSFGAPPPPAAPKAPAPARSVAPPAAKPMRAEESEKKAKGEGGILRRMKQMITGAPQAPRDDKSRELYDAEAADLDAPEPAPLEEKAAALREIAARIAAIFGEMVVIELETPEGGLTLHFEGARALVRLADGTTVEATIQTSQSTREGSFPAGLAIRIGLQLPAPPVAGVARVELTLPSANATVVARV